MHLLALWTLVRPGSMTCTRHWIRIYLDTRLNNSFHNVVNHFMSNIVLSLILVVLPVLRLSHSGLNRFEDLRTSTFGLMFTRPITDIGANTTMFEIILNSGKMNSGNRLEYSSTIPHIDSEMCGIGWAGLILLYRFVILNDKPIDFRDRCDFIVDHC